MALLLLYLKRKSIETDCSSYLIISALFITAIPKSHLPCTMTSAYTRRRWSWRMVIGLLVTLPLIAHHLQGRTLALSPHFDIGCILWWLDIILLEVYRTSLRDLKVVSEKTTRSSLASWLLSLVYRRLSKQESNERTPLKYVEAIFPFSSVLPIIISSASLLGWFQRQNSIYSDSHISLWFNSW